jgi:hypothetical protein
MPRLYRPHVPVEVRCRVLMRQIGTMFPDDLIAAYRPDFTVAPVHRRTYGKLFRMLIEHLAETLNCKVADLRLDHDPALAARPRVALRNGRMAYNPDANDPEHLIYREKHDHHIKTNVRGDGAQYPDRVLIKRERKRRAPARVKAKRKWASRPLRSGKTKWPKRKFRS